MAPSSSRTWSVYFFMATAPTSSPADFASSHKGYQGGSADGSLEIHHCCEKKPTEITRVGQSSRLQLGGTDNKWVKPLDIMTN